MFLSINFIKMAELCFATSQFGSKEDLFSTVLRQRFIYFSFEHQKRIRGEYGVTSTGSCKNLTRARFDDGHRFLNQ